MSLFRRKLLAKRGSGDVPNLAIDTDFTTPFDHLAGRKATICIGKTKMQQNKKYHVVCDVEIVISERNEEVRLDFFMLGGYGQWRSAAALGKFYNVDSVGVFNQKVDYTGQYYSTDADKWLRIDCGSLKGTVRLYNIVITEVI